ncbi:Sec63 complex subunit SEC66 NDAI_0C05800 [Naumovozyma dairenensis CBS 421]|uniref:Translocation protein SEC66 n=1 Tax=Naumovozyma dairenensis (strain ATCC 10597 / BCRC 20456 / CBS 421 / NBRC 0211 / NRRL Y-12639) TaxID=1071378 RepID=G0W8X8_NAUDC|nr:hypothetical protein NDAI_0C05800 [Naumovozyma dairenensis CBS 421]CCD24239.1 hypothetical protein NDAI_0C05800 [Naumovozyma dairenensis CBS 421]
MSSFNETFEDAFNTTSNGTYTNNTNGTNFNGTQFNQEPEMEEILKNVSFYTPIIYSAILLISLLLFASQYKKSQLKKRTELPSIFDENDARDLYFEIKSMDDVHEKVIKAALLNRGAEAIRRSLKMKELEPQIELIYKNGSVGEEYWQRFQNEMKLMEVEFKDCIQEAEALQPGWVQLFVGNAREICFNQAMQRRFDAIIKRKEVSIKEWDLKLDDNGMLIK